MCFRVQYDKLIQYRRNTWSTAAVTSLFTEWEFPASEKIIQSLTVYPVCTVTLFLWNHFLVCMTVLPLLCLNQSRFGLKALQLSVYSLNKLMFQANKMNTTVNVKQGTCIAAACLHLGITWLWCYHCLSVQTNSQTPCEPQGTVTVKTCIVWR